MPDRYYILTTRTGTQNIREYFEKEGIEIHPKRKGRHLSDYFILPGMIFYTNMAGEKGLVKSVAEFEDDEGDMKKLEEIARIMRAVKIEDTFKNEIKF